MCIMSLLLRTLGREFLCAWRTGIGTDTWLLFREACCYCQAGRLGIAEIFIAYLPPPPTLSRSFWPACYPACFCISVSLVSTGRLELCLLRWISVCFCGLCLIDRVGRFC